MKDRKPACMLLVVVLIFTMALTRVGAETQTPNLFVSPLEYTATYFGEVFTVDIKIANVSNLQAIYFKLGYNTTILDVSDVVEGSFMKSFGSTFAVLSINETGGYVDVALVLPSHEGPAEGNGTLATITFNATYYGPVSCILDLYDTYLYDSQMNLIDHEGIDGYYKFLILSLTVKTSKQSYFNWEIVDIYSNLTANSEPIQGLVALEVDAPNRCPLIVRTMQTGSPPIGEISILQAVPCTDTGAPKTSFKRGATNYLDFFYVKVTVRNSNPTEAKNVLVTANSYDVNDVSLGVDNVRLPVEPNATIYTILSIPIPEWASVGNAMVYANAFTDWPGIGRYGVLPLNGTSHCPEKLATFQITDGTLGTGALGAQDSGNSSTNGNCNLTFSLSLSNELGNYTAYVSASYQGFQVANSTTFDIILLGDVNGDGKVNILDVATIAGAMALGIYDPDYDLAPPSGPPINILDVATCAGAMAYYGH